MNKIVYLLALGIGITGCSNDRNEPVLTDNSIKTQEIKVTAEVNKPLSRAGYTAMYLESFGLMVQNAANTAYSYHKQMILSEEGWNASDGQQMLWDMERNPVTVTAYAPYNSEAAPDAILNVSVEENQETEADINASDFLLAKTTVNPQTDLTEDGLVKITLNHAMSKLIIKVKDTENKDIDMEKLIEVTVKGGVLNGTCDLSAENLEVVAAADATPANVKAFKGTDSHECILPPQTIAAGAFSVTVMYGDKLYEWTATKETVLAKETAYTLTININPDAQPGNATAKSRAAGTFTDL